MRYKWSFYLIHSALMVFILSGSNIKLETS